jgi:hypothetical protein
LLIYDLTNYVKRLGLRCSFRLRIADCEKKLKTKNLKRKTAEPLRGDFKIRMGKNSL